MYRAQAIDSQLLSLSTRGTASGAIATFDTDRAERLVNLEVAITATGGGGTPTTPIAINGFSACNLAQSDKSTVIATGSKLNVSASGEVLSVTQNYQYVIARVKQGVTYSYSINGAIATNCPVIAFFKGLPQVGSISYNGSRGVSEYATFTAPVDGFVIVRGGNTYDEVNMMISVGSTVSAYEQPTTETIPFGQTVYGGRLNVGSGVLTVTHKAKTFNDLSWSYNSTYNFFNVQISDCDTGFSEDDIKTSVFESIYGRTNANMADAPNNTINHYGITIKVKCSDYTDPNAFKTAFASEPIMYKLATPVEIQLDSKQIQAIIGTNNIYADTGDIIDLKFVLSVGKAIS